MNLKATIIATSVALSLSACSATNTEDNTALTAQANSKAESMYGPGVLKSIQTPAEVNTSIGKLEFFDGVPTKETAQKAYDHLDTARAMDVFLKGMPAASVAQLMHGPESIGAKANSVVLFNTLMNSKPLYLTANTSTMYALPSLDMKETGPVVLEVPAGMLGAFNDAWFRYAGDIGPFGQDKGKGGKYLVLPPGYEGDVPEGYFVVKSQTYRMWVFMRASIANGVEAAEKNIKENLKVYPLSEVGKSPETHFVDASDKYYNTVHANDETFYTHLNDVIQHEPLEMIDAETRGLLASIGIEKGKEFAPDERMKRILKDGVAIANATARSIVWYPRTEGSVDNMKGIMAYPDSDSGWTMAWVDKNVFFNGKDKHTMNSDARVMFHYPYTAVTPAMAVSIPGKGSDYAMAFLDAEKNIFDGGKTYKVTVPANAPAADFWAFTLYDTQTRSQLQTSQPFPTLGSQSKDMKVNDDGSTTIYFGPEAPKGWENNWLQTIPHKSWLVAFRMYGPEKAWVEKTWRVSEIELVK